MVTETLFESSLGQMSNWIKILEKTWAKPVPKDPWELQKVYQKQLINFMYGAVQTLSNNHKQLVKNQKTNEDVIAKHTRDLSVLLQTLWLRQSFETFIFFGSLLINILPNKHCTLRCILPPEFEDVVNGPLREIGDVLKK